MEGEAFWVASLLFKSVLTHRSRHVAGMANLPGCVCMRVSGGVFVMWFVCVYLHTCYVFIHLRNAVHKAFSEFICMCVWVCVWHSCFGVKISGLAHQPMRKGRPFEKTASLFVSSSRPVHRGLWIDHLVSQAFLSDKSYWVRPADCHMTHDRL